jgi:hypothetical protein
MRIKHHLFYFRKELRKFGIVVHELSHVVGFYEKSAHINHPFRISGKNCDKFGIVVHERGNMVGF